MLYPFLLWTLAALAVRRLHDRGRRPAWLLLLLVPLLGPLLAIFELGFRPGTPGENPYGPDPREAGADYFKVRTPGAHGDAQQVVNDVTQLNPVSVFAVATPTTVEEVQDAVRRSTGPLSVGGGRLRVADPDRGNERVVPIHRVMDIELVEDTGSEKEQTDG